MIRRTFPMKETHILTCFVNLDVNTVLIFLSEDMLEYKGTIEK